MGGKALKYKWTHFYGLGGGGGTQNAEFPLPLGGGGGERGPEREIPGVRRGGGGGEEALKLNFNPLWGEIEVLKAKRTHFRVFLG